MFLCDFKVNEEQSQDDGTLPHTYSLIVWAFRLIIEYVGNSEDFRDRERTSTKCADLVAVNQIFPT